MNRERFAIELEATGNDSRPAVIRLRTAFKVLLRAFGLKAVSSSRLDAAEATPDALDAK